MLALSPKKLANSYYCSLIRTQPLSRAGAMKPKVKFEVFIPARSQRTAPFAVDCPAGICSVDEVIDSRVKRLIGLCAVLWVPHLKQAA